MPSGTASNLAPDLSLRQAIRAVEAAIARAPVAAGPGDARFLALHVLGLTALDLALRGDAPIGPAGAERLAEAMRRRAAGEPVARILGEWEFWGLPFRLSPETLVPRPDTETLVEAALAAIGDCGRPLRILDLGTGSGCILVALLTELPRAFGLGLDRSFGALATARGNARLNGVGSRAGFLNGDWCASLEGPFDLIVSNPPYIPRGVIPTLSGEVRGHDPALALDGGADGLDAYRRILAGVTADPHFLHADATLAVEIGFDQAASVAALGRERGLDPVAIRRDLAGHDRVVVFHRGKRAEIGPRS
ncbi:peptide chain release factor N(5)-glutamine methyltransferase [Methylobacterium planeticum]|uniref:Release factor glutamine methyltransferase n=1 Tax=Methylobacterium planeticum TaxID=2615211 RepID=A0A6N6MIU5_9HYPH|nr:peptide chain release factor N(5)-glutamine methyltransferase [Methylobacterium planeticum]KAB1071023.1 peptide chain release factor N(5)-glutamine methyltransferase [Methylobacterium planeticum]